MRRYIATESEDPSRYGSYVGIDVTTLYSHVPIYSPVTGPARCLLGEWKDIENKFLHLDAVRRSRFDQLTVSVAEWNLLLRNVMLQQRFFISVPHDNRPPSTIQY